MMKQIFGLLIALLAATSLMAQDDAVVTLNDRLKSNLFLKVYADKTECYVGEPITVTYKLYSSLESESNIIKAPVLNGFSSHDLLNGQPEDSRESVDGVTFDVHTVRKILATPLRSGRLQLDALVMANRIRLMDARGNKSPLLGDVDDNFKLDNGYYRLTIASVPISVTVRELPGNNRPAHFEGAVGKFNLSAYLNKSQLQPNEVGTLMITVSGFGDFDQINVPAVGWPKFVEAFPSTVQSNYNIADKQAPGTKTFKIPFGSGRPGTYTIPPISISYFDAGQNKYVNVGNPPLVFTVTGGPATAVNQPAFNNDDPLPLNTLLLIGGGILAFLILALLLFRKRGKKRPLVGPGPVAEAGHALLSAETVHVPSLQDDTSIASLLQPASHTAITNDGSFYPMLKQAIIKFFEQRYHISAALFNRSSLKNALTEKGVHPSKQDEVFNLLTEIEMNLYSGGSVNNNKMEMLRKAQTLLEELQ